MKIRDKRNKGWFWLDNEYLNGYARYFGAVGTAIYISLCRHVGEEQTCFPSQKTIAEELNIGERTIRKYIKLFEKYKIISVTRNTDKTTRRRINNVYTLLDKSEWKKPEASDASGEPEASECKSQRHQMPIKKTHIKKTHLVGKADNRSDRIVNEIMNSMNSPVDQKKKTSDIFNTKEIIEKVINDKQKHIRIVGIYWKWLGWSFENEVQYKAALGRDLKPASALKGYSLERIKRTFRKLDGDSNNGEKFAWNLNTVHKTIDNVK